eukprot:3364011-Rhodomonas_salina.1
MTASPIPCTVNTGWGLYMLLAGKDQHHEHREQNDTDDRRHNTALDALNHAVHSMTTESESMTLEEEGSPDAGDHGQCSVIDN